MTVLASPAPLRAAAVGLPADAMAWEMWLRERLTTDWRPTEWNHEAWLFTGDVNNPRTSLWPCSVRACVNQLHIRHGFCKQCAIELGKYAGNADEFVATYVPKRRAGCATVKSSCLVERDGQRCTRPAVSVGACDTHYGTWHKQVKGGRTTLGIREWMASLAVPFLDTVSCHVIGCGGPIMNSRGLCAFHWRRWSHHNVRTGKKVDARDWAAAELPFLGGSRFSLIRLAPLVKLEFLYALQHRDTLGKSVLPPTCRNLALHLADATTLLDPSVGSLSLSNTSDALLRQLRWSISLAYDQHRGISPTDKDVLDLPAIGLRAHSWTRQRVARGTADLTEIPQPWLRELVRVWVDAERPAVRDLGPTLRAATLAGQALSGRPGGGQDVAALQFADMTAVAAQFRTALRLDGEPYTSKTRHTLFSRFCDLLNFGRKADMLDHMSGSFVRHSSHRIVVEDTNEGEIGKAIPEFVIRQLNDALHSIGADMPYGRLSRDDIQMMFRTVYIVLRDTGRRPGEVACLRDDCLETIDGETSLVWENRKGKRLRRRLPITSDTAHAIGQWQLRRRSLPVPEHSTGFLFPAISHGAGAPHIDPNTVSAVIREWVGSLPALVTDTVGPDGEPLSFDRTRIFPRAFRNSYAQRHADEGTPVDVLKDLMDHVDVNTTMGYYTVSLRRKQQAVKTLSARVVDRDGNPAPFRSGLAYERSAVAVPFGGCTEPSNVKAGGHACRIRFQCAGCGFYRPDPSYLSAIEQQINDLRADRETAQAMGAAEFVIRNLTEQIDAYGEVITKMRTKLAELPADERAEIEDASAIMRRARAGSGHLKLPITPVRRPEPPR
ncbi:site-specific integrase [Saccharothrix sp. AJ9571]|nr:site-specific integrase [Saccharothrix sp. AJ9571]